ncbi:hypothetical protein GCM10023107_39190 [Actinoplanes octamycinicus]|nr:hypothetical protein Aoc01nite_68400 [Actinoplanes octamycinicus]
MVVLLATAWVTPAQAVVGVYSRAFVNKRYSSCLWVSDHRGEYPFLRSCASAPNDLAKYWLHEKEANWNGTGHPMWVIQSQAMSTTSCIEAKYNNPNPATTLVTGTCNWAAPLWVSKQFEAFWVKDSDGVGWWVMKSIDAWVNAGQHLCIGAWNSTVVSLVPCNTGSDLQRWKASAAAPVS